jgi:RimJ/RimL family protein N-acetyltransferase
MKHPFLVGESVYLRAVEHEDAAIFLPWVNDFEVARNMMVHRPMSLPTEEAFVARIQEDKNNVVLTIVLRKDDRVIGNTALHGIHSHNHHAGFGIMIGDKREWGRGYGTEAANLIIRHGFDTLNLHRIWLHVYDDNPRAIRSYEKVGFRREGVLREHSFREGRYGDVISMAILREEWAKEHRVATKEPRTAASKATSQASRSRRSER